MYTTSKEFLQNHLNLVILLFPNKLISQKEAYNCIVLSTLPLPLILILIQKSSVHPISIYEIFQQTNSLKEKGNSKKGLRFLHDKFYLGEDLNGALFVGGIRRI